MDAARLNEAVEFTLSLLRLFKKPLPDVFRDEVMTPIGASTTWKWVPYTNSYVDIAGKRMASVAGGTRWGDRQIVPASSVKEATTPSAHGPDYGLLWWLNTKQAQWAGSPANAFSARGQGGNIIFISPSHDLVVVWRWSAQANEGFRRIVASITS